MEVVLYASNGGTLVLVPDCFEPSSDLVHTHGRFRRCGRVHITDRSCPGLCRRIAADFDQSSYSILSDREAQALFGPETPRGSSDRRGQPREVQLFCRQQEPGGVARPMPGPAIPPLGDRPAPAAATVRAWASIRAIAIRGGTSMREFVRFARMAASSSPAGNLRPDAYPHDAADCTTSREL